MLKRKAMDDFVFWKEHKGKQALLVTGARQVGKTYLVREFAAQHYEHLVEINLLENKAARQAFDAAADSSDLFLRLSAFATEPLVPGKTLVFIDEVQESKETVTAVKFLVDRFGEYDYVLSGSLLGVELKNLRSVPVGYLDSVEMFPLDFEEYCWANGVAQNVLDAARNALRERRPVDEFVHQRLLRLFHEYLIAGGMPDPVSAFVGSHNVQVLRSRQNGIIERYREDISKYAENNAEARAIKRIFDLMPSELSQQNKRFVLSSIEDGAHFDRLEDEFLWLADAGVALPVYNVREPRYPLMLSMTSNFFKLFMNDVGLLTCMLGMDAVREVIADRLDVNFGALYENVVAQELRAHGFPLYYFKSRAMGELDFVVEHPPTKILPIEVKSGKSYKRHSALTKVLSTPNYGIDEALVLCEGNVEVEGGVTYLPVYGIDFLER